MSVNAFQEIPGRQFRPKILFVVTEDWYFWSHRLPIARSALQQGYEVVVATRVSTYADKIKQAGFRLWPLRLSRSSYSPLQELLAIRQLRQLYRAEKPEIIHHVALKPVLYGSIAALGMKDPVLVNAFAGLGYLVSSSSWKARLLRPVMWQAFHFLLNRGRSHLLLQNNEDQDLLIAKAGVPREKTVVIRGSGVNTAAFCPSPEPDGPPIVLLPSRMLWIKGVEDFVRAAALLREKGVQARFVLAGDNDPESPGSIPKEKLLQWQNSGVVEWWGHQKSMREAMRSATIVCLPSHGGEGVPKALLEAAAAGRAIVTTEVPGCKDVVRHGANGLLVKPREPADLAEAIDRLLKNDQLRLEMGKHSREIAVDEFSEETVIFQTLALYAKLLHLSKQIGSGLHAEAI